MRMVLLVFASWLVYQALEAAVWLSLLLGPNAPVGYFLSIDAGTALLWTGLTFLVAWWHSEVRSRTSHVALVALMHVPGVLLAVFADSGLAELLARVVRTAPPRFWWRIAYFADQNLVRYLAIVAIAEALFVRRTLAARDAYHRRVVGLLNRARLDFLEAQLQPHFLFNALSAVAEFAHTAPAVAGRVVGQLSAMLRATLAAPSDEVPLREEMERLEPYLDIQRMRFADWLTIEYRVDPAALDCLVPRFVLQPLVENAIRHGLTRRTSAGEIAIAADRDGDTLSIRVTDNGAGLRADAENTTKGHGIGLTNVRHRLAILYGDDDRLRLTASGTSGVMAELRIPARTQDVAPASRAGAESSIIGSGTVAPMRELHVPALFRNRLVLLVSAWTVWGLIWAQQSYVYLSLQQGLHGRTWLSLASVDLLAAGLWAILTPPLLAVARRVPLRGPRIGVRIALNFFAGLAIAAIQATLFQTIRYPQMPLVSPVFQSDLIVGFFLSAVILAIGQRAVLLEWRAGREAETAALAEELSLAQARTAAIQAFPPVLLASLDAVAETIPLDAARAERQIARLGDYLRIALESSTEADATFATQRQVSEALHALRECGAYPGEAALHG